MTSVISDQIGASSVAATDGLDVTQGEEALEQVVGDKVNKSFDASEVSTTTESLNSVGSDSMDASLTSTSESAAQSPDSAIGGTPDSTPTSTPEKEDPAIIPKKAEMNSMQETPARIEEQPKLQNQNEKVKSPENDRFPSPSSQASSLHEVESSLDVRAGDRLNEDGYDEDDEGEEGEEDDSLSDPELVVSGQMQFSLAQKSSHNVNEAVSTEKHSREGTGEVTVPLLESGQGVSIQVNSQVTGSVLKDGSPSGCESDIEDNDDDDQTSSVAPSPPNSTPAPKPLHGSPNRIPSSIKLPDTVTRLDTPHGSSVFLVGTAHFSRESQEDVAETIRTVKPDIVVVELCKARTAILQLDEETILQESRSLDFKKMQMIIRQHGKIQGVLYLLLLSVSAHITKQLGMAPGGEFRTAFAEARRSSPGCLIQLGDRPIQVTLSRALASLSLWHKLKLTWHILTSKEPISKEEVEKCKQRDFIEEMLAEMTGQFPAISEVFVKERDLYLCRSLQAAAQPGPNPLSPSAGITSKVVVGVVGIGHVPGIVEHWGKVTDADIAPIMRIPPPSLSSRLLKAGLRVSMYSFIGYGIYKCLPGSAKSSLHTTVQSIFNSASTFVPIPWQK